MSYQQFGIDPALVERVKRKLRDPQKKQQIGQLLEGVTKQDLQNSTKVRKFVVQASKILNENLTQSEIRNIVHFVISMKIDPKNTFHLIKLWGIFR